MNRKHRTKNGDEMLPEYDFSKAVRGKYYEQYRRGTNVVLLDPDISDVFPDAAAVNAALRLLVAVADAKAARPQQARPPTRTLPATNRTQGKAKAKPRSRATRD